MATVTKIVVHFDNGTTQEIPMAGMTSLFVNEAAAVKCGHNPPYKQPPTGGDSSGGGGGGGGVSTMEGGTCYYWNGVIVCP